MEFEILKSDRIPLRYAAAENPRKIIEGKNEFIYHNPIGSQVNGFRGIDASMCLISGSLNCYQLDVYADTRANFTRHVARYAPHDFKRAFGEFKNKIAEYEANLSF